MVLCGSSDGGFLALKICHFFELYFGLGVEIPHLGKGAREVTDGVSSFDIVL
jgi:hypothetical protein